MELAEITTKEYGTLFRQPYHIFNSIEFSQLNQNKFEKVHYLAFRESKYKAGIILGERAGVLYSPTAAPFGGITYLKEDISIETLDEVLKLLEQYGKETSKNIEITLPPIFYDPDFISKCINAFSRSSFSLAYTDLNFQLEVARLGEHYIDNIPYTGKKNLNNALKTSFVFKKIDSLEDITKAYSIIKINRESKGYPLKMSLENVLDTINVVKADFFILSLDNQNICAAQVFHVAEGIVQVIYWGDIPGFGHLRPMNILAYEMYEYYRKSGCKIIDIGPSTEFGIPNYGLCQYKTTIGCSVAVKNKYILKLI